MQLLSQQIEINISLDKYYRISSAFTTVFLTIGMALRQEAICFSHLLKERLCANSALTNAIKPAAEALR